MANSLSDEIRSRLTTEQAARYYGFEIKRSGFIACPFHTGDHTASLKIFPDGGWWCFGCNKGSSVIDFVMELFNINFQQACMRLDSDFRLGLINAPVDRKAQSEALRKRQAEQREAERKEQEQHKLNVEYRFWRTVLNYADPSGSLYAEAVNRVPYLDYLFEEEYFANCKGGGCNK